MHIPSTGEVAVELYWCQGSGIGDKVLSPFGWECALSTKVQARGKGNLTTVREAFEMPAINKLDVLGIFIFIHGGVMLYSLPENGEISNAMSEHICAKSGPALAERFDVQQGVRKFNGALHYTTGPLT